MDVGRRDWGLGATENPGRVLHRLETLQDSTGLDGGMGEGLGHGVC